MYYAITVLNASAVGFPKLMYWEPKNHEEANGKKKELAALAKAFLECFETNSKVMVKGSFGKNKLQKQPINIL